MSPNGVSAEVQLTSCLYRCPASWWNLGCRQRGLTWRSSVGGAPLERRFRWRGRRGHGLTLLGIMSTYLERLREYDTQEITYRCSCGCESLHETVISCLLI